MACPTEFETKIKNILEIFQEPRWVHLMKSAVIKNLILVLLEEYLEVPFNQAYCRTVFRCDGFQAGSKDPRGGRRQKSANTANCRTDIGSSRNCVG
jgi:hypothetical protein